MQPNGETTQTLSSTCPAGQLSPSQFPLRLSDKAIEMALAALNEADKQEGEFLRVSIHGGGCAGFQYALGFSAQIDAYDLVTEYKGGLKVVTDVFTVSHIDGTFIDYVETLQEAGFKFDNPQARRTCGCSSSFSA